MTHLNKFLLAFLLPTLVLAQSTWLPVEHRAYDFLERMETLGTIDHPLLGAKPVTRARVAELLDEVYRAETNGPGFLSEVDLTTLKALRWEFARDNERAGVTSPPAYHPEHVSRLEIISDWMDDQGWFTKVFYRNGINFYTHESELFDGYIDPRGMARVISQEGASEPIIMTAVGVRFRGYLNRQVGIHFEVLDITEQGRGPYWGRGQLYEDRVGYVGHVEGESSINYDVANFDLAIGGSFWELHVGKMPLRWGPGRSGQLLLSDWATSFHQAQAAFDLGSTLRLTYVFGSLKTYPEQNDTLYQSAGYTRTIEAQKYIAAHRLEWDPHPRLRFGFAEAVVFGERAPELAYLIPINLFYSAQHDLGDEDNTLMAFDAGWIVYPGYKAYGELLIDDVTLGELGGDYFGNKIGWLAGLTAVEPLQIRNIDATVELAQLRPFIYSHQYPVNVYNHYSQPLGYRYPPNSRLLFFDLRYRPHWRVELEGSWTYLKHGANPAGENAGGDIYLPHAKEADENAPFLDGDEQTTTRFDLQAQYEALTGVDLFARGSLTDFEGDNSWEWEVGFRFK